MVRVAGLLVGLAIVAWLPSAWPVAGAAGPQRSTVSMDVLATGEIALAGSDRPLRRAEVARGARRSVARGGFVVHNRSSVTLPVRFRAHSAMEQMDRSLRVRIDDGRRALFVGSLDSLRRGTARPLSLRSGETRDIRLSAWLPRSARGGWQGDLRTTLELLAELPRRR